MSLTSKSVLSSTITHTVLVSIAGVHQSKSSRVTSRTLCCPRLTDFPHLKRYQSFTYTYLLTPFCYLRSVFLDIFETKKREKNSPKHTHKIVFFSRRTFFFSSSFFFNKEQKKMLLLPLFPPPDDDVYDEEL